jgi:hypothetical protein
VSRKRIVAQFFFKETLAEKNYQNSWFQIFAVFWNLYVFFWVFSRRQIKFYRRFGTLCQVHLQRLDEEYSSSIWRRGNTQKKTYKLSKLSKFFTQFVILLAQIEQDCWFQRDGATAHTGEATTDFLHEFLCEALSDLKVNWFPSVGISLKKHLQPQPNNPSRT